MVTEERPLWSRNGLHPSLHVGVPAIDREHAELISELDALTGDRAARPEGEVFSAVLGRLGMHIGEHFAHEEKFLRSIGMPDDEISRHVGAHDEILEEYTQINLDLMEGKLLGRQAVLASIRAWLIGHIVTHDIQIRRYLPRT